jgi:hypothetical protein
MAARGVLTYLAVGVGAVLLSPVIIPTALQFGKPLMKGAIKGGVILYRRGREVYAEVAESAGDMLAEAVVEIAQEEKEAARAPDNVTSLR